MNNATRKQIDTLIDKVGEFCDASALEGKEAVDIKLAFQEIQGNAESLGDDEQQKYDDASDALKDSGRAQKFQEAADSLYAAASKAGDITQLSAADCDNLDDYYEQVAELAQEVVDELEAARSV